jgi:hypothetical protein
MYEVANITSYSRFGLGAYLSMVAVALLAVAFYYRNSDATARDAFRGVRSRGRGLWRRIRDIRGGAGEDPGRAGETGRR